MDISGNSILITGGATGIGYSLAEAFLAEGNEVIICGRREERLLEAKNKHQELHFKVCDLADAGERRSLAEWINANHGRLNILVNNAGIQRDIDFTEGISGFMSGENEITINLEAPIILTGLFTPILKGKKGAAIINISSGLGFVPAAKMPVYCATKAGLHAFSMAIRHQLLKTGIKVFEVVPPAVDTELNPEGRALRGSFKVDLKPGEFVAAVMKGLKNDKYEIGYGMTEGHIKASREDLDRSFMQMNSRW
jgi:Short-chain dehydrogenase involved in D-alanine esterification of lipoteichoic acid and wall teichoic acid (D-alanine transfer protein)